MRLVTMILILSFSMISGLFSDDTKSTELAAGSDAPTFSLPDMNSEYVFLRDFCGNQLRKPSINKEKKVVVLSFFSTTCVPCRKEIPQLIKLNETYREKAVKIILIGVGETRDILAPYLTDNSISLPVLVDQYQVVAQKYAVTSLPRLVVIDKEGKVQKYKKGYDETENFQGDMSALLDNLLVQ